MRASTLTLVVLALPVLVLVVVTQTAVGPTLVEFSRASGTGLHLGDVVALVVALPLWLRALAELVAIWRRAARSHR